MSYAMGRMGYSGIATPHGFRSLATDVLNENGFPPDVIER
ncbi:phage integrase family site-specific recombinase [Neisseria shayeganii 871]|uniref:Phage integrase family site-specific recombinase n=1 Tax=Neisseria shayeganii 871 TaxID=1032488 RepID=G4CJW6_9NEIS|nr:phage integrase family site-specific recombinase [Neisseria shayeganii 871]